MKFVERVANKVLLEQIVVEMDYEDLEQVDRVVEARSELLRVEAHFVLSGLEGAEVVVVKLLVYSDRLWIVRVLWARFHK